MGDGARYWLRRCDRQPRPSAARTWMAAPSTMRSRRSNIEIGGMPNITLEGRGGHHVLQAYCRMIQYDAAADDWYAINDWFLAPGFTT